MTRWFRFYSEAVDDPKVQMLSPELFKAWVNLLCIAAVNDGVTGTLHETAFRLRVTVDDLEMVISELIKAGLIDKVKDHYEPHNWSKRQYKSDTSSERVKRYRQRSQTVSETPPEYRVQIKEKKRKNSVLKKEEDAGMTFVAKDTPEWEAWRRVKKVQPVRSEEHRAMGWWFPSRFPQQQEAAA